MAAITPQALSAGGGVTLSAASGGGDTIAGGMKAGGWGLAVIGVVAVGGTATTVSVNGTAIATGVTNTTLVFACGPGYNQTGTTAITYSQVTGVTVGAARLADTV